MPVFEGFIQSSSDKEEEEDDLYQEDSLDLTYDPEGSSIPLKFCQVELNDLVRVLGLSKSAAELLASRLKEKNQLTDCTKITYICISEIGKKTFCHISLKKTTLYFVMMCQVFFENWECQFMIQMTGDYFSIVLSVVLSVSSTMAIVFHPLQ